MEISKEESQLLLKSKQYNLKNITSLFKYANYKQKKELLYWIDKEYYENYLIMSTNNVR